MDNKFCKANMELQERLLKSYERRWKAQLVFLINNTPRDELIKILKQRRVIKYDWSEEAQDNVLIERVDLK